MMEGVWTGHSGWVWALSWSPSGQHLASGSSDTPGTILIRNAESGQVEVGPINANQGWVRSIAYSPSGDRIASGGINISIWDSHTGELRVGPIQAYIWSIVWSLDGSKLYSGGYQYYPACVFDSASGTELHRFQHNKWSSIALSPKHNLLAGVGLEGIAQLWDTESYQPLGQPFHLRNNKDLYWVSFSPDERYLAYGGDDRKVTLRLVKDSSLQIPTSTSSTNLQNDTPQEPTPASPSPSHPDIDTNPLAQSAVKDSDACDDPYNPQFMSSLPSSPSPLPKETRMRRLRDFLSRFRQQTNQSRYLTRGLLSRRTVSNSPLRTLARTEDTGTTSKGKSRDRHHGGACSNVDHLEAENAERDNNKDDQQQESTADMQTSTPGNLSSPTELDSDANRALWKLMFHFRRKDRQNAPADSSREVYAKRVPKGHGVLDSKYIKSSAPQTAHASGPPRAGPSSQPIAGHAGQAWPVTSTNHISNDSDSDWRIEGCWNKFLDRICYPSGHYDDEDT